MSNVININLADRKPVEASPPIQRIDYDTLTDREKAVYNAGRRVGCDEGYLQGLELVREIAAYMGVPVPRHLVQAI